jgi:serralysin
VPDPELRVCLDRPLDPAFDAIAEAKAAAEQVAPGAPLSPIQAALVKAKRWKNGRTLKIRFLDGESGLQQRVAQCAKQWLDHANLNFDFGNHAKPDIRIAFVQGAGSWSALGTDALVEQWFPQDEATMNYGWLRPSSSDMEIQSVTLHEFGHALGLIHEHQAPGAAIAWNKELIYRQLGGPPNNWPRATVDHNVFNRMAKTELNSTNYDKSSIMHYFFPSEWTTDGTQFTENENLSSLDKSFIKSQYPKTQAHGV